MAIANPFCLEMLICCSSLKSGAIIVLVFSLLVVFYVLDFLLVDIISSCAGGHKDLEHYYFEVQNRLSVANLIKFSLTNYHGSFVDEELSLSVLQV